MIMLIFLAAVGAVVVFSFLLLAVGGLFFGGECPHEKRLYEMDERDYMLSQLEQMGDSGKQSYHITDARSVHYHQDSN